MQHLSTLKERLDPYAFARGLLEDPTYNAVAMAEEIGECHGKLKKHMRDGLPIHKDDLQTTISPLAKELGDVLFYLTYYIHSIGSTTNTLLPIQQYTPLNIRHHLANMADRAGDIVMNPTSTSCVHSARILYINWLLAVESIGYTPEEILQILIQKISSRQARGTQAGSGDDR